jgi:hypothetical protein
MPFNKYLALGADAEYIAVGEDNQVYWAALSSTPIRDLVNGRYGNSGQTHNSVPKVLCLGSDDSYFLAMQDGSSRSWGSSAFNEAVDEWGGVYCMSMLDSDTYIALHDDGISWRGVPHRMAELIKTRSNHAAITWAQLGAHGAWFLLFGDGTSYWGGLPSKVEDAIRVSTKGVSRLYLSSGDYSMGNASYFIEYDDNSAAWEMSENFSLEYKASPIAAENGYSRQESRQPYGDHHIWRHEDTGDVIEWWGTTHTAKTTVKRHPKDGRRRRGNAWNKDLVRDNVDVNGLIQIFRNIRAHTGSGRYHANERYHPHQ